MPIDPKKRGMASADPEVRRRAGAKGGATKTAKTKFRGFGRKNALQDHKLQYEDLEPKA